tara:strand:- start:498 stop:1106 length:609 start_codon:yes stop_codon:yes gene_type:complete
MSKLINQLIHSLTVLPGVGKKTAARMAYYLLEKEKHKGLNLSETLKTCIESIDHCRVCHNLTELPICELCSNTTRDPSTLCIVESPSDLISIEQTRFFKGYYFVLMGRLSPLDNITPKTLPIDLLLKRCQDSSINEIIIATNPTIEGEATAQYLIDLLKQNPQLKLSRLAHGIPMGGEIEYLDTQTIARAMELRTQFEEELI